MNNVYTETVGLCPICGADSPAFYEEKKDGMHLHCGCSTHGTFREKAECDPGFFRRLYEQEYERPTPHLVFPVTYRCNLKCKYCYTLSNLPMVCPEDRSAEYIVGKMGDFNGNVTLIGGEPTVRPDLLHLIRSAKDQKPHQTISIGTNGQRLREIRFARDLKDNGLDFVFLSLNDLEYDESETILLNKMDALGNCHKLGIPVWLQRTIDNLSQLGSLPGLLETYRKVIFNVTIRAVKPFGLYYPAGQIFVSDIIRYLGKADDFAKGTLPFNCFVRLNGKKVKICSWINDMKRVDPLDSSYIISDNTLTTFHRGMKMDEVLLMNKYKKMAS